MKKNLLLLLTLAALASSCSLFQRKERGTAVPDQKDTVYPLGFCTDSFAVVQTEVRNGETFTGLFGRLGLSQGEAYSLATACDSVFDVRKMRAGGRIDAYSDTARLRYAVYQNSKSELTVFRCSDSLAVWKVLKPVAHVLKAADVTIETSLWNDMLAAGASPLLIVELADIYAWTVDFFGLQKGDRFKVLYREDICDGEVIDISGVDYATFTRGDKTFPAVFLDTGSGNRYWSETGESMRKAFLKAPLKFSRVSSGFSYHRKHPVHGIVRPHTGVDYAAPTGTPVMSIGDGTVISKGWGGGGGNTVKIRHNSVYTTAYLHLSRYASGLKVGDRVTQGQVIGYVGMTGTATGPHLDFRVWKNGTPINPLTMESPSAEPLPEAYMPRLDSLKTVFGHNLDSLLAVR